MVLEDRILEPEVNNFALSSLRVATVQHTFDLKNNDRGSFLGKLQDLASFNPDVILGPEFSLTYFNQDGNLALEGYEEITKRLREISYGSPKTLIVPGTMPVFVGNEVGFAVPILRDGKIEDYFFKERDVFESDLIGKIGRTYHRGNSSENKIEHAGRRFSVEICADNGTQVIDPDTDVQMILFYCAQGGIRTDPYGNSGKFVVSANGNPKSGNFAFKKDIFAGNKFSSMKKLEPKALKGGQVFELQ